MICPESDDLENPLSKTVTNEEDNQISYFDPYADLYTNPLWIFFWCAIFVMVQILGNHI